MPRVADRLSIIHPCLGATQHPDQAQGQLSLFTGSIGILQNEISGEKDNSCDSKMKLACHAERGTQWAAAILSEIRNRLQIIGVKNVRQI